MIPSNWGNTGAGRATVEGAAAATAAEAAEGDIVEVGSEVINKLNMEALSKFTKSKGATFICNIENHDQHPQNF